MMVSSLCHFLALLEKSFSHPLIRADEWTPEWVWTLEKNVSCPRVGFFEVFVKKQKKKGHVVTVMIKLYRIYVKIRYRHLSKNCPTVASWKAACSLLQFPLALLYSCICFPYFLVDVGGTLYSRCLCRVIEHLYIFVKIDGVKPILQRQEWKFPVSFCFTSFHVTATKILWLWGGVSIKLAKIIVPL